MCQLRDLGQDGHLQDVATKSDFYSRIRNACVIGPPAKRSSEYVSPNLDSYLPPIKTEGADVEMFDVEDGMRAPTKSPSPSNLPSQYLALTLESGELVFLFPYVNESNGQVVFMTSRHMVSKSMLTEQPGRHMAIDPSSRYLAVACAEKLFSIYELQPPEEVEQQSMHAAKDFRPTKNEKYNSVEGVIHKMEFLYPSANDRDYIILVLLVVIKGITRMQVYEWEAGQDLTTIKQHDKKGKRGYPILEAENQMPLLLIPLTFKSAFLLVGDSTIAVCTEILAKAPKLENIAMAHDEPSALHHGVGPPLWTAWTRPPRLMHYTATHDDIYIAREDGLVQYLEISYEDYVKTIMHVGVLSCNIGTGFSSLDSLRKDGDDILIATGDMCTGGMYTVSCHRPRHKHLFHCIKLTSKFRLWREYRLAISSQYIIGLLQ